MAERETDKRTLTGSLNRGLNPFNIPDYYRQYRSDDPDQDGPGDFHNPHEWEEPDRSRRDRFTPDTTGQWLILASIGLFALGLALYFRPIISSLFRSPIVLGLFTLASVFLLVYLKGRQDGVKAWTNLDKWVRYTGDDLEVAAVERVDADHDNGYPLFETIKRLSFGGFNKTKLQRRDLPFKPGKLKRYPTDAGDDPARDAGNAFTFEAETDTVGKVYFTHCDRLKWADGMEGAQRWASNPKTLDEDAVSEANRLINELSHKVESLTDTIEMVREDNESKSNMRQELYIPQLEQTLSLLSEIQEASDPERNRQRQRNPEGSVPQSATLPPSVRHHAGTEDSDS